MDSELDAPSSSVPTPETDLPKPDGPAAFVDPERIEALFEHILSTSTADETELVWFERRHGELREDGSGHVEDPKRTVIIRVVEGARLGWHRTGVTDPGELSNGVRLALAVSKVQPRSKSRPVFPTRVEPIDAELVLHDDAVAALDLDRAREWLEPHLETDEAARVHWAEIRVAVANSHGVRRMVTATEVDLAVRSGDGRPGTGRSASAERRLADLDVAAVVGRARARRSDGAASATLPATPVPAVIAPEATIVLLHVLNTFALAGRAYLDGSSFLVKHRNVQVFDRKVHVRDDGLRVPGLPFPFDLEGTLKRPVDLIVDGQPSTPALSRTQGQAVGMVSTGQSVGGQDSFFGNLFMLPGAAVDKDLLAACDGGLWIGWIDTPECFDPERLGIRCVARGVRRIVDGALGEPLPDLIWETTLLGALARLHGIGRDLIVRPMSSTPFGGIAAPAIALAEAGEFSIAD